MDGASWQGRAVLITGAASGIGRVVTLQSLRFGARVTAVDLHPDKLLALEREAGQLRNHLLTMPCDVSKDDSQVAAFTAHEKKWGALDLALLNAGVTELGSICRDDNIQAWQPTLDIDLRAVLVGAHIAARAMQKRRTHGTIISVASAAAFFPHGGAAVYCTAKSGVVQFTKSIAPVLAKRNIHIATVCPQMVDTPFLDTMEGSTLEAMAKTQGGLISVDTVASEIFKLAEDRSRSGEALFIRTDLEIFDVRTPVRPRNGTMWSSTAVKASKSDSQPQRAGLGAPVPPAAVPAAYRAWHVTRLTPKFEEAVEMVSLKTPDVIAPDSVLVRRLVTGVNASDVNFTSGKYHGSEAAARAQLPFAAGFESVGVVCKAGAKSGLQVGQPVAMLTYGGFSEYGVERARFVVPVRAATPEVVAFLTSGLTASIALEQASLKAGETALVTAAAGGTGLFAVQLCKLAGLHVIGTCGSEDKAAVLRELGVDRVVNYKTEDLKQVLKREYKQGVDVVYESVGGDMFKACVDAVAMRGRLLVIGMMSQYGDGWPVDSHPGLPEKLLKKSASLIGFFLPAYAKRYKQHLDKLSKLHAQSHLKVIIDKTKFVGVQSVPRAVQHLQSGRSFGKVVVYMDPSGQSKL